MWSQVLVTVIQVLPALVQTISELTKEVEASSPDGGGEAKRAAVIGLVKASVDASDKFARDGKLMSDTEKEAVVEMAGQATDLVVGLYNTVGTFKKG